MNVYRGATKENSVILCDVDGNTVGEIFLVGERWKCKMLLATETGKAYKTEVDLIDHVITGDVAVALLKAINMLMDKAGWTWVV